MSRVPVTIPKIGLTAEEVTVDRWLKEPGESVNKGEQIAELMTDKAVVELEAPDSGVLTEITVERHGVVPIGATVAYIETEG